jgi:hypothetical protein
VSEPCDYVALSYVWGPATVQGPVPEGKTLPDRLPRTVEDAMTVAKELGLRYLWVDRFCLDRSNMSEFQSQLDQMADIYRHALATIIGAAGSDADYGLPGVSTRARTRQPRVRVGDLTLWSSMTDPRKLVRESAWMTRAWTYQEGIFSWNWLAFTDEQVFFQRSNKEWSNMERWWKVSCEMFPQGGLGADVNCPLLNMFDNVWKNEGAIHVLLSQYTDRSLTYQSDAVNGALGLLRRCENGPYCTNHYFGVPILGPLINHRKAMGRDPSRIWTLSEAFLVNLCWKARSAGLRRPEFPSWSWAGWQVVYEMPTHVLTYMGLFTESLTEVKLYVAQQTALTSWEDSCRAWYSSDSFNSGSPPRELYIDGPTVSLTVGSGLELSPADTHGHAACLVPMSWCAVFAEEDCDVFIEVNLVDAAVDAIIKDSGTVGLEGILLRQKDPRQLDPVETSFRGNQVWAFALLVLGGKDGAARVGTLELRPENYFVRWRGVTDHEKRKKDGTWVRNTYTEYMDCFECRSRALRSLVGGQQSMVTRVV